MKALSLNRSDLNVDEKFNIFIIYNQINTNLLGYLFPPNL